MECLELYRTMISLSKMYVGVFVIHNPILSLTVCIQLMYSKVEDYIGLQNNDDVVSNQVE